MPASTHLENLILRYTVFGEPFVINSWWASLHTSSLATEANQIAVGRTLVTWDLTFANSNELLWPMFASTGTVASVGIWDAAVNGNRLTWRAHSVAFVPGQRATIAPGSLRLDILNF